MTTFIEQERLQSVKKKLKENGIEVLEANLCSQALMKN